MSTGLLSAATTGGGATTTGVVLVSNAQPVSSSDAATSALIMGVAIGAAVPTLLLLIIGAVLLYRYRKSRQIVTPRGFDRLASGTQSTLVPSRDISLRFSNSQSTFAGVQLSDSANPSGELGVAQVPPDGGGATQQAYRENWELDPDPLTPRVIDRVESAARESRERDSRAAAAAENSAQQAHQPAAATKPPAIPLPVVSLVVPAPGAPALRVGSAVPVSARRTERFLGVDQASRGGKRLLSPQASPRFLSPRPNISVVPADSAGWEQRSEDVDLTSPPTEAEVAEIDLLQQAAKYLLWQVEAKSTSGDSDHTQQQQPAAGARTVRAPRIIEPTHLDNAELPDRPASALPAADGAEPLNRILMEIETEMKRANSNEHQPSRRLLATPVSNTHIPPVDQLLGADLSKLWNLLGLSAPPTPSGPPTLKRGLSTDEVAKLRWISSQTSAELTPLIRRPSKRKPPRSPTGQPQRRFLSSRDAMGQQDDPIEPSAEPARLSSDAAPGDNGALSAADLENYITLWAVEPTPRPSGVEQNDEISNLISELAATNPELAGSLGPPMQSRRNSTIMITTELAQHAANQQQRGAPVRVTASLELPEQRIGTARPPVNHGSLMLDIRGPEARQRNKRSAVRTATPSGVTRKESTVLTDLEPAVTVAGPTRIEIQLPTNAVQNFRPEPGAAPPPQSLVISVEDASQTVAERKVAPESAYVPPDNHSPPENIDHFPAYLSRSNSNVDLADGVEAQSPRPVVLSRNNSNADFDELLQSARSTAGVQRQNSKVLAEFEPTPRSPRDPHDHRPALGRHGSKPAMLAASNAKDDVDNAATDPATL